MKTVRRIFNTVFVLPLSMFFLIVSAAAETTIERISIATGKIVEGAKTTAPGPVMTVYHAGKPNGAIAMIYPGGGYSVLVVDAEGHRIAKWFNEHGVTAAVVEYRLPAGNNALPLADAHRATRIARLHAKDWKCDPMKIGNIGFSAGGHLASTASTRFDAGDPTSSDPIERQGCRPDFSILIYPVITMGEKTHQGSKDHLLGRNPDEKTVASFSNEKQVTADTPPTFLAHALNDTLVVPENSKLYHEALLKNGVSSEYLELPSGGHGLDGYQGPMWAAWKAASLKWLAKEKFIPKADAN